MRIFKFIFKIVFVWFIVVNSNLSFPQSNPTLDGVWVDAVETFLYQTHHNLDFSLKILPFNAYYNGFGLSISYSYNFNKDFGWQIINGTYVHTVNSGLTSELAEKYNVNPKEITKLSSIVSSSFMYTLAYGKLLFLNTYIRYFKMYILGGGSYIQTTKSSSPGINLGVKVQLYINDFLSTNFDVKDDISFKSSDHFVGFGIGFGFGF